MLFCTLAPPWWYPPSPAMPPASKNKDRGEGKGPGNEGGLRAGKGKAGNKIGGKPGGKRPTKPSGKRPKGAKPGHEIGVRQKPKVKVTTLRPQPPGSRTLQSARRPAAEGKGAKCTESAKGMGRGATGSVGRARASQAAWRLGRGASSQSGGAPSQSGGASSQAGGFERRWGKGAHDQWGHAGMMRMLLKGKSSGWPHKTLITILQKACVLVWEEEGYGGFDAEGGMKSWESAHMDTLRYELKGQWGTALVQRAFSQRTVGAVCNALRTPATRSWVRDRAWLVGFPWFPAGPEAFVHRVNVRLDNWGVYPMYLELDKRWWYSDGRKMGEDVAEAASSQSGAASSQSGGASGRTRAEAQAQEASGPRADELTEVRKLEARMLAASTMLAIIQAPADMRRKLWLQALCNNHPDKQMRDSVFFHEVFTRLQEHKDGGEFEAGLTWR